MNFEKDILISVKKLIIGILFNTFVLYVNLKT